MTAILFVTTESSNGYSEALRHHGYRVTEVSSADDVRAAVGRQRYGLVIFEVPVEMELFRFHYNFIAAMLTKTPRILLLDCRQKKLIDKSHPEFDLPLANYQVIQKPIARYDFVDRVHSVCGCRSTNVNRVGVAMNLEAYDGKNRYDGIIRNISSSGLRLHFPGRVDLKKGDILHVRFGLAIGDSDYVRAISCIAEVVWLLDNQERRGLWPWRKPQGMATGLEFSQMNYDDKAELKRFVEGGEEALEPASETRAG